MAKTPKFIKTLVSETRQEDFELLQTIAAMPGLPYPPSEVAIAKEYGITRQAMHDRITRLRALGLVEEAEPGKNARGVLLTHNAKRLIENALDAELKS